MVDEYWDRLAKEQMHEEILEGQERIAKATAEAGQNVANAAYAAGLESSAAAKRIAEELQENRNFQIFWDTLSLDEKKQWKKDRDQRVAAEREAEAKIQALSLERKIAWERFESEKRMEAQYAAKRSQLIDLLAGKDLNNYKFSFPLAVLLTWSSRAALDIFADGFWVQFIPLMLLAPCYVYLLNRFITLRKHKLVVSRRIQEAFDFFQANLDDVAEASKTGPWGLRYLALQSVLVFFSANILYQFIGDGFW